MLFIFYRLDANAAFNYKKIVDKKHAPLNVKT